MLNDDHLLNYGRAGVYGNRSGNFVLQNSDLVIAIGNRMAIPMIGYEHDELARDAKIIQVDIDEDELLKTKNIAELPFNLLSRNRSKLVPAIRNGISKR